jgi:hypothetical protein
MNTHHPSGIHDVLTQLTDDLSTQPMSPAEAHLAFRRRLDHYGIWYDTYLRTALSTGGFHRDEIAQPADHIHKNAEAALLAEQWLGLTGEIYPKHTWNAASLGSVPHFEQSDYLEFCFYGIMRPDRRRITSIESEFKRVISRFAVNLALLNDNAATSQERLPEYRAFSEAFWHTVEFEPTDPINRMVSLFDNEASLGSLSEDHLAHLANINQHNATFSRHEVTSTAQSLSRFARLLGELDALGLPEIDA